MSASREMILHNSQPTLNLPLILATVWIIKNDFAVYTISPVTVGQYAINIPSRRYQNDLIDEMLRRSQIPQAVIKYLVEGEMFPKDMSEESMSSAELQEMFFHRYANREKSIWFLDSLQAYKKFEKDLVDPKSHYHRSGFFLLVYTGIEPERLANVKEIFRRLFYVYVTNVNVMMMVGKYPYVYTYFPFAPNKCHSSTPEYYASFRGIEKQPNFTLSKPLFPSKLANMYGCALTVATWTYPPYIYVDKDEKTGELTWLHGIEGSVITLLSELMNFTIRIKEPEPKDRGYIFPNGSATGASKMILEAEANITIITYVHDKARTDVLQPSNSYLTLPFILAMPQGRPMSPFDRLVKPFRYIIWSCFSSSFFFAIILIYYIRFLGKSKLMDFVYGQGNRIPFTNLLLTLFGGAIHNNIPYRNFARFLLTGWLLYTLVLRSAYSGALFTILQDGSSRNTLKTLQEVVDNNYTIYAFPELEKVLKRAIPGVIIAQFNLQNTVPKLLEIVSEPNTEQKIALCLLDFSIRYYNQRNPTRRVERLEQPVISAPLVFYMPRHTYLRMRTTHLILRMLQSGLMKRFRIMNLYTSSKPPRSQAEPTKLSFHLLLGVFWTYATFLLFCHFVFILEILSQKSNCIKVFLDFLNL